MTIDSPEGSEDELPEFSTAAYQIKTRKSIIVDFIGQFSNLYFMLDEGNKGGGVKILNFFHVSEKIFSWTLGHFKFFSKNHSPRPSLKNTFC
jgi:hypothetical protein